MGKLFLMVGAVSGFLSVAAGAFGAHGLKDRLTADGLAVFETAARYHMYHALALVLVGVLASVRPSPTFAAAGWAWIIGTVVFSGSLYALALTGVRGLGAITPIGGLAFLVGWALLAYGARSIGPGA